MSSSVLKSFILGSSAVVFVPFYIAVLSIPESKINLKTYAILAALYFGTMNALAAILRAAFGLSLWNSLLFVTILSILIVSITITIKKPYDFQTKERWLLQYLFIAIGHSFAYLVLIYNMEKLFASP